MQNHSHISGNQNIVIQGVNDSTITVHVNGDVQEIRNQLEDLKILMQNIHIATFQVGEKLYHLDDINEENFPIATSKRVFNGTLVKHLLDIIQENDSVKDWLKGLSPEIRNTWEIEPTHLQKAQSFVVDHFLWVLAWELRRLFAVGLSPQRPDDKIEEYIRICFSCYRKALQVANYLLISTLWDIKKKHPEIKTDIPELQAFFGTTRLTPRDLRQLLIALLRLFNEQGLQIPLKELQAEKTMVFTGPASTFNQAAEKLEQLMDMNGTPYRLGHCHTAEYNLAAVLKAFPFFTTHQLVTIKRVEYEAARHSTPRFIKDFSVLERKRESKDQHSMKIDHNPTFSYALFFRNNQLTINLFPFLLDYNVLINELDFQVFLYENRESLFGLYYYSVNESDYKTLSFSEIDPTLIEIKSGEQKREVEKNIRIDLAIRQFEDAMNTLLGTGVRFKKAPSTDSFDNI